uniref:Uncharacterized protein n=1 Tax=Fagus sylvatica TaxID=28930 RepID=A0A2N9ECZ6_FAGSY
MKFLLIALKIFYVLEPNLQPIPNHAPEDTEQLKEQRIKKEEDELVCKGHILNTLSDRLYDLFTTMSSPKEIWKALETKYKTEKQGTDKFIIQKFLKNQQKDKELNTSEANVVDEIVAMVSEMQIGMITEVHMASAAKNSSEWWYDYGATIHVCNNKTLFKEYVEAGNGLEVLMGNHNTAKVLGTGTVELKLSSGNKFVLTNVYHVPDIKQNLVSASLLSKNGVKAVLESDKLILSKNGVFVGKANGFKHNGAETCVYSKFTVEYGVIVCLYMDDMLIFGTNMLGVCETKKYFASMFKMKDLNEANTILGIKVKKHSKGYALCQNHYIEKVLLKYKHLNVEEVNTPFDSNYKLIENTGRAIAQLEYASAIGSMMYVMHCTRPDVAFAVNRLSRYTSSPSVEHWKAITRVLGYLKKIKDLGLYYSGYPAVLERCSYAN